MQAGGHAGGCLFVRWFVSSLVRWSVGAVVCLSVRACVLACWRSFVRASIPSGGHTGRGCPFVLSFVHAFVRAYERRASECAGAQACWRSCVRRAFIPLFARACVLVVVRSCWRACMLAKRASGRAGLLAVMCSCVHASERARWLACGRVGTLASGGQATGQPHRGTDVWGAGGYKGQ